MKRIIFIVVALVLAQCASARAEMQYLSEPVYKQLNPDDPPPMQDMQDLANGGDVRAMYILGNLYAKGQGGLPQDKKLAEKWFEQSAQLGYFQAFVRLAALARQRNDWLEEYKWYDLGVRSMDDGPWRTHAQQQRDALMKDKKFSSGDLDVVRKEINVWKSDARRAQAEERDRVMAEEKKEAQEEAQKKANLQKVVAQKKDAPKKDSPETKAP